MKHVVHNSLLTFVLFGFLMIPLSGFLFIGESEPEPQARPVVLGAAARSEPEKVKVVDQIEYQVGIGSDSTQKIYNVLPSEYLSNDYQVIVSVPQEISKAGVLAELNRGSNSADLMFTRTQNQEENTVVEPFRVILIVLK